MITQDQKRISSLDGLRGISICAVMLAHAAHQFGWTQAAPRILRYSVAIGGYLGVSVFFVISGFLITKLLLKELEQSGTVNLKYFYRRRAVRILPASLFYIAVILLFGKASLTQATYAITFTTTYWYDFAYKPLQQLWSLSVEEQFYLFWPVIFCFGIKYAKRYCWLIMFVSPVLRIVLRSSGTLDVSHVAPCIADILMAGCLLAIYEVPVRAFVKRHLTSGAAFSVLCVFSTASGLLLIERGWVLLWGPLAGLLAVTIAAAIERRDAILNRGPLVWIGLISYSLYLWQQPFLCFDGPFDNFPTRICLTFAAAFASYALIEQPALKIFALKGTETRLKESRNPCITDS